MVSTIFRSPVSRQPLEREMVEVLSSADTASTPLRPPSSSTFYFLVRNPVFVFRSFSRPTCLYPHPSANQIAPVVSPFFPPAFPNSDSLSPAEHSEVFPSLVSPSARLSFPRSLQDECWIVFPTCYRPSLGPS